MIKTTAMLKDELKEYVNPAAKIRRLVDKGELIPVVRRIYETDNSIPGYYLATLIYGPSYLSFEFALSYYGLIPETAHIFTSATFEKKKAKQYETPYGIFSYRDVPSSAYPVAVFLQTENGYGFQIASPEKAICDELYKISPLKNQDELEYLLFEDLRIDKNEFFQLNPAKLFNIATHFSTQNHKLLQAYLKRRIKNGPNN